ncbi:N(alpha)-acetyltransferase 20, NatB catalytic subunit [Cichlidogyrus casuarinus]|uniref:N(Alpha)-acetyltransferase 20, NatB catalytic subunit n=1 Tax=Cichlidogyrus casuarinus TaxID=1844966 RepID=A0ABD2Q7K5_9PLAT
MLSIINQLVLNFSSKGCHYTDLFVKESNVLAQKIYEKLGYIVYRRVLKYYNDKEDAFDMRKALSADVEKKSVIPFDRPIRGEELEFV